MLKKAYELGFEKALEEEGLTKEAFTQHLTKLLESPTMGKVLGWGAKNPTLAMSATGAGIGGLGGAMFGDEGGFARGALMGAGIGAGAGLGLGTQGRKGLSLLQRQAAKGKLSPKGLEHLKSRAWQGLGGAAAGGVGAGLLGASAIPNPQDRPWHGRF
jgi:hypothetical protein